MSVRLKSPIHSRLAEAFHSAPKGSLRLYGRRECLVLGRWWPRISQAKRGWLCEKYQVSLEPMSSQKRPRILFPTETLWGWMACRIFPAQGLCFAVLVEKEALSFLCIVSCSKENVFSLHLQRQNMKRANFIPLRCSWFEVFLPRNDIYIFKIRRKNKAPSVPFSLFFTLDST